MYLQARAYITLVSRHWRVVQTPLFFGIVLMILSSGCTMSMSRSEYTQHFMATPTLNDSLSKALGEGTFSEGSWPNPYWWTEFGFPELNQLMEVALCQNPTIQQAYERIEQAKNEAIIVRSDLFPVVFFNGNDNWLYASETGLFRALNPTFPINSSLMSFNLSVGYEFDFWGKYRNRFCAAIGKYRTAIAETAQAELITTTALAQAFFALQTDLMKHRLYAQLYDVRRHYYELQKDLLQTTLESRLAPLLSEEKVSESKKWLDGIVKDVALDRHLVNILAGRGPDTPINCDENLCPLAPHLAVPTCLSAQLLWRRPDLVAQIWTIDALSKEVGAAKAEFLPDFNLQGLIGYQSGAWPTLFEWISRSINLIPGFSLPIYTSGAIGANVGVKKALFNESVFQYNERILLAFQQVADLLAIGQAVYDQKQQQTKIVASAEARYELTQLRQQKGLDNALHVYALLEQKIQKQLEDVQLLYQQYVVSISLIKALGGGYGTS